MQFFLVIRGSSLELVRLPAEFGLNNALGCCRLHTQYNAATDFVVYLYRSLCDGMTFHIHHSSHVNTDDDDTLRLRSST